MEARANLLIIQRCVSVIPAGSAPHCIGEVIIGPGLNPLTCKGDLLLYLSTDMSGAEVVAGRKASSFHRSNVQSSSNTVVVEILHKLKITFSLLVIFPNLSIFPMCEPLPVQ